MRSRYKLVFHVLANSFLLHRNQETNVNQNHQITVNKLSPFIGENFKNNKILLILNNASATASISISIIAQVQQNIQHVAFFNV